MQADRTVLAILLSLAALTLFDGMGLIIKLLSGRYSAAELSAWRNLFGLIPAMIALWGTAGWHSSGRPLVLRQWKLAMVRGVIVSSAQLTYYLSLGLLSFATASTITYANALFMTALAVPLLGEKVGWLRWAAVLIGFIGVVIIVGPGRDSFSPAALLPLGAAVGYALVGVTARMMDREPPTALINLYSTGVSCVVTFGVAVLFGGFTPITSLHDLGWIIAMGAFGGSAVLLLIASFRMAEQSDLAPFSYFGIPLAFFLGWLFFDEAPWSELFPGALLIAVGGLLIIWRERRLRAARIC